MDGQNPTQAPDGPYYSLPSHEPAKRKNDEADDNSKKTKRNRYIAIAWWAMFRRLL